MKIELGADVKYSKSTKNLTKNIGKGGRAAKLKRRAKIIMVVKDLVRIWLKLSFVNLPNI
jgi:hypothetical protein